MTSGSQGLINQIRNKKTQRKSKKENVDIYFVQQDVWHIPTIPQKDLCHFCDVSSTLTRENLQTLTQQDY